MTGLAPSLPVSSRLSRFPAIGPAPEPKLLDRPHLRLLERRNVEAREQLVDRIRREFQELPTLCLTLPQASRLFSASEAACVRSFVRLAEEGVLRFSVAGLWVRVDNPM